MHCRRPPLYLLIPLLCALSAPGASADVPATHAAERWLGEYRHIGGEPERIALERLVVDMAARFNVLVRPLARHRLEKTVVVPERIEITHADGALSVRAVGSPDLPDDPSFEDGAIVVRQSSLEGSRQTVFRLEAGDEVLTMHVTTSSALLPQPIDYRLTFRRAVSGLVRSLSNTPAHHVDSDAGF